MFLFHDGIRWEHKMFLFHDVLIKEHFSYVLLDDIEWLYEKFQIYESNYDGVL